VDLYAYAVDSGTAVYLDWDTVTDATGYHVYRWNPDPAAYERLTTEPLTATSWTDTTAATTHFYWVTAVHADGTESAPDDNDTILPPAA
jgi:fibronectin type 3 domain-containing protein